MERKGSTSQARHASRHRCTTRAETATYSSATAEPANIDQGANETTLQGAGADVWGYGGETYDQYTALYRPGGADSTSTTTVEVDAQSNTNGWARSGIMLRDSVPGATTSLGYAVLSLTPSNGVSLAWDNSSSGYLNQQVNTASVSGPVWLRLIRNATQVTGEYSTNDSAWTTVATETLTGSNSTEDVGMFTCAHNATTDGQATFTGFTITG